MTLIGHGLDWAAAGLHMHRYLRHAEVGMGIGIRGSMGLFFFLSSSCHLRSAARDGRISMD